MAKIQTVLKTIEAGERATKLALKDPTAEPAPAKPRGVVGAAFGAPEPEPVAGAEDLGAALETGGYYTAGFTGSTVGEYRQWYQEEFKLDPFELSESLGGGKGFQELEGRDPSLEWISEAGMPAFDPDIGFLAPPKEGQETSFEFVESRIAARKSEEAFRQGTAMMDWLMGQAISGDPEVTARLMPVGMARAGAQLGQTFQAGDYSGFMAERYMQEMQAQAKKAGQFDFVRDLLPSLIQLGGAALLR